MVRSRVNWYRNCFPNVTERLLAFTKRIQPVPFLHVVHLEWRTQTQAWRVLLWWVSQVLRGAECAYWCWVGGNTAACKVWEARHDCFIKEARIELSVERKENHVPVAFRAIVSSRPGTGSDFSSVSSSLLTSAGDVIFLHVFPHCKVKMIITTTDNSIIRFSE